jgi:ABC-type branched-subunit amino acid transport system substrate-binding protein
MQLAVRAVIASDGTKENIRNKLYEVSKNYQGVSGNLEFDQNGDVIKSILVKQIKNGKFAEYKQ